MINTGDPSELSLCNENEARVEMFGKLYDLSVTLPGNSTGQNSSFCVLFGIFHDSRGPLLVNYVNIVRTDT